MSRMVLTGVRIFSAVPVKIVSKVAGTHTHSHPKAKQPLHIVKSKDRLWTAAQHLEISHCRCKVDIKN